jgi:AcrR family transcriptional regulator
MAVGEKAGDSSVNTVNEADPRVKRTRKLLVDAFSALLAEKSFQAVTVQDIAERATVNRATFYAHFEDKFALMDWIVRDSFREALQRGMGAAPRLTSDSLRLLVVTVCEYLGQFHGHCAPGGQGFEPMIEAKVQQELYTFLLGWLEQMPTANREAAASVMSWAIFGAGIQWSRGERPLSADDWARQILHVIVGGVTQVVPLPALA